MGWAEDKFPPLGEFITVEGVRLHYVRKGKGNPAVLIHGASGNLRDWTFGPFSQIAKTNDTIAFDRPGFGYSERPYGADDPAVQARLLKLATSMLGFNRPLVVGHSLGGSVALSWGLLNPVDVAGILVISAPSHDWPEPDWPLYKFITRPLIGPVASEIIPYIGAKKRVDNAVRKIFGPQTAPDGYLEYLGAELALRPKTIRANAADVISLRGHIDDMMPHYNNLVMPIEIIHGDQDATVPVHIHSDRLAKTIPHANYTRIEGMGHMPHHFAKKEMLAAITRLNEAIS